ncbi:unnamed protein product, partial [Mesorhabditis belari]|uniref:Mannosyltransferase n=1 Tax=Mesorhabditis belari TaxID=2138241 RepID=A0AAF3ENN3_9BILA
MSCKEEVKNEEASANSPTSTAKEAKKGKSPVSKPAPSQSFDVDAETWDFFGPSSISRLLLKLLFLVRITSGFYNNIYDCDEVFNYWEPLHLFLYGSGLQTWEYSPDYALRSYIYIFLHAIPGYLFKNFPVNKVVVFLLIRILISLFTFLAEYLLFQSIKRFSEKTAQYFLILNTFSVGMFISSSAFLPSSFSMTMNMLIIAGYLTEKWFLSVLATCVSAFVGWPFAAIFGIPIVFDMLLLRDNRHRFLFTAYSIFSACIVGGLMITFDSFYYGKLAFAPLNIVLYNVISGHGPELYGVEPVSFYIKNLILNWNIANLFAVISLPIVCYRNCAFNRKTTFPLLYLTFCAWIAIFFLTPHKEERFLFPLYPMVSLFAALALDAIDRYFDKQKRSFFSIGYLVLALFTIISAFRLMGLHKHYFGAHQLYREMNDHFIEDRESFDFCEKEKTVRICVGKEWHRFPSSFFLPEAIYDVKNCSAKTELSFLKSEFRGLLPKAWISLDNLQEMTSTIPTRMNDENKEENDRYVPLETCDYVIDVEKPNPTELEPNFGEIKSLTAIRSFEYLLQESCPLLRPILVPFLDERLCKYVNYTLYRKTSQVKP